MEDSYICIALPFQKRPLVARSHRAYYWMEDNRTGTVFFILNTMIAFWRIGMTPKKVRELTFLMVWLKRWWSDQQQLLIEKLLKHQLNENCLSSFYSHLRVTRVSELVEGWRDFPVVSSVLLPIFWQQGRVRYGRRTEAPPYPTPCQSLQVPRQCVNWRLDVRVIF